MKVLSWNVNGLRASLNKGFRPWFERAGADVVGLQEVRASSLQLAEHLGLFEGWHHSFVAAERPGYSGVALASRRPPDELRTTLGRPTFDVEGRFQLARYGKLTVVNAYFPNGSGKERDNSRIPYKLAFCRAVFDLLEPARRQGERLLVMGDFNVAHREIDLARPKDNVKTSGFTPIEREEFDRWLRAGWVDTFRHFEPGPGHYSWWSQRAGVRARNVGWRIDYVLASPGAMPFVRSAFIQNAVLGSDHCPVGVELDPAIVGEAAPISPKPKSTRTGQASPPVAPAPARTGKASPPVASTRAGKARPAAEPRGGARGRGKGAGPGVVGGARRAKV
jgi:exodeoxyribonuclease-3